MISTTNTGNSSTSLFSNGVLMRAGDMHRPRWCPSATALGNGEVYLQGGAGGRDRPEVREPDGSFRLLSGVDTSSLEAVGPRNFLAPDGRVFGFDANGVMYYVDPSGTGRRSLVGQLPRDFAGRSSSAAMFRPGRILQVGGNSNKAAVIDITGPAPVVTATQPLSSQRQWANATVMADGRVVATGGSAEDNHLNDVNTSAEIWDPVSGSWTVGRRYHPDGREGQGQPGVGRHRG